MREWERRYEDYMTAKKAFDAAERIFLAARSDLVRAERARSAEWEKLTRAAEALPPEDRVRIAAEQWGSRAPE